MSKEEKRLIVLDFGHGGTDPGAIFCKDRGTEASWINNVGLNIYNKLRCVKSPKEEIVVRLTRCNDIFISIDDRAELLNKFSKNYDLVDVYSLHANAADHEAKGTEIFLAPSNTKDKDWAKSFLNQYCKKFKFKNRGVKVRKHKKYPTQSHYGIQRLTKSNVLVKIIEFGFVTNDDDSLKLWDMIDEIAEFTADFIKMRYE